jgi:hypothetical protein
MPEIGLTDFVDFALKSGPSQLTKVRELKLRPDYDPATDYWKRLREWLIAYTAGHMTMKDLSSHVKGVPPGKEQNFNVALAGFKKFVAKMDLGAACQSPSGRWTEGELAVRVNPELCFVDGVSQTCLKLYFKADPRPTKDRLGSILILMKETLPKHNVGVLDVRSGRLYDQLPARSDLSVYLRAQAQAFLHMWKAL